MLPKHRILLLFLCLSIVSLLGGQEQDPYAIEFNLDYRSLQPGEIIKVNIHSLAPIRQAHIRFLKQKFILAKDEDRPEVRTTFLGLDLNLKPGTYILAAAIQFEDGFLKNVQKEISVIAKEFPQKKLWVDEKFVTPPAEALERIRTESKLIQSIYSAYTEIWLGEGSFIVPTPDKVNPNFGERRVFNNQPRSPHTGIDISSPQGTPVKASNSGRIVFANDLYYAGNTVIIDHGLGVFSFYCHFSKILAVRGDTIQKGDIIGEVGATGRVTGPHLHWSVRVRNSRIDPFSLLYLNLEE